MQPVVQYLVGVDLGQPHEPTAVAVLEQQWSDSDSARYQCRHLERFSPGIAYGVIAERVQALVDQTVIPSEAPCVGTLLVVDATSVGRAVVRWFETIERATRVVSVVITTGHKSVFDLSWHVPRKDLVAVVQSLLESGRIKIARGLPERETLEKELVGFRNERMRPGVDSLEAWRQGAHDDLVFAVALAAWYGERQARPAFDLEPEIEGWLGWWGPVPRHYFPPTI